MSKSLKRDTTPVMRVVFAFTLQHWARHKGLAIGICLAMSLATMTEIFVPYFAGHLIDAISGSTPDRDSALWAFAAMAALGLAKAVM